jgi:hypothetical protein
MDTLIDLRLYADTIDFLEAAEADGRKPGGTGAALEWGTRLGLEEDELGYVLAGVERMMGFDDESEWTDAEPDDRLDTLVWTFHRAWVDRHGWTTARSARSSVDVEDSAVRRNVGRG